MNFYKYYSISENTINAIKGKYFYCSRPSQLNDLFDCRVPIEYENKSDSEIEEWIRCNGGGWLRDLLPEEHQFPYDTAADVREAIRNGSFDEYFYTRFNKKEIDSFHVLSLTNTYKNQVLWGTYTDNKGICIEFKSEQLPEPKLLNIYLNNKAKYGLHVLNLPETREYFYSEKESEKLLNIYKVNYDFKSNEKFDFISDHYMIGTPESDIVDSYPLFTENLITKNKDWSYENEYRALFRTYGKTDEIFDNKIYYSDEVVESITFGYNISDQNMKKVLGAIKEANFKHEIKFYKIKPDYSTKSIERYPIKLSEK